MAKKQKKEEYVELNGVLGNAFDYHVYHMQFTDYLIAWILGFVLAMVVILIFFGSVIFGAVAGVLVAIKAPKFYAEFRKNQRLNPCGSSSKIFWNPFRHRILPDEIRRMRSRMPATI